MPGEQASDSRSPVTSDNIDIRFNLNNQFAFYMKYAPLRARGEHDSRLEEHGGPVLINRKAHAQLTHQRIMDGAFYSPPSKVKANQKVHCMTIAEERSLRYRTCKKFTFGEGVARIVSDSYKRC
jgi:hypothetical protein